MGGNSYRRRRSLLLGNSGLRGTTKLAEAVSGLHCATTIWAEAVGRSTSLRRTQAARAQAQAHRQLHRRMHVLLLNALLGNGDIHEAPAGTLAALAPAPLDAGAGGRPTTSHHGRGLAQKERPGGRVAATATSCGVVRKIGLEALQSSRAHRHVLAGVEAAHLFPLEGDLEPPRGHAVNKVDESIALVCIGLRINGQVQEVKAP
mmetsp:Transcript_95858/g.249855  ORF Transcript_95858/g.249855 Transcript_95858/m.249855 type:complete len:204 (-) Transcript_95858:736-1347(-)